MKRNELLLAGLQVVVNYWEIIYNICFRKGPSYLLKLSQMRLNTPHLCRSSYSILGEHCLANYSIREIAVETLKTCLKMSS